MRAVNSRFQVEPVVWNTHSEAESFSGVPEQRTETCPIKAQSTAIAWAMARICNAERLRFGMVSGHERKTLSLSGQLIGHINSHGMHDLCEHGWQGQFKPLPADAVHPEWRYEGFYGLLRVTPEDGADWLVAVLAPLHFVCRLAYSVAWYRRNENAD